MRPHKTDLDVAAALLRAHATPMDVLAFKVYEWRLNDDELAAAEKNVATRRDVFLPAVAKALRGQAWVKEYEIAFAKLEPAEQDYWEDLNGEKLRRAWVKVASLVWYALDNEHGGDYQRIQIAERYDVNPGMVTRSINKIASLVALAEEPARERRRVVEIPQPLDYESDTALKYYGDEERGYYINALERYSANEGEFDLANPIIAGIIHQIILNSYAIQRLNRDITKTQKDTKPLMFKRLAELQDSNAKNVKELIGLQKELGKLERNEESLSALKRRLVEVKEGRDAAKEAELEAELFEMTKQNSRYLGFVS